MAKKHRGQSYAVCFIFFFSFACFLAKAQSFNSTSWVSYLNDKNHKMVDSELVEAVAVSNEKGADYIYIVGQTFSIPTTVSNCNNGLGKGDAFLAKFTNAGKLKWIKYIGGAGNASDSGLFTNYDWGYGLALDKSPDGKTRIYVGGTTVKNNSVAGSCTSDHCTSDVYQKNPGDGWDGFIGKFDDIGNLMRWTYFGGGDAGRIDTDEVLGLQVYNHQVYAVGYTESRQNTLLQKGKVARTFDSTYNGGGDAFIAVFDTCLSSLSYFTYLNSHRDSIRMDTVHYITQTIDTISIDSIGVDSSGMAIYTVSTDTITTDSIAISSIHEGTQPTGQDRFHSIKLDAMGNVYTSGTTSSTDGIALNNSSSLQGGLDALLGKWIADPVYGYKPDWMTYIGGSGKERGRQIDVDDSGNIYMATVDHSDSTTLPAIGKCLQRNIQGNADAVVAKFGSNGILRWRTFFGGAQEDIVNGIKCIKGTDGQGYEIAITGLTKSCDLFSSKLYQPSLNAYLNGVVKDCNLKDSSLKRDAFVAVLSDPDTDTTQKQQLLFGTYLGGSKGESYGPYVAFTGYGPTLAMGSDQSMYVAFSSGSKDVGDANHCKAAQTIGKYKGTTDAIVAKIIYTVPHRDMDNTASSPGNYNEMLIYPQPASSNISISFLNQNACNAQLNVFDETGALIYARKIALSEGDNHQTIDISSFPLGIFLIQVAMPDKGFTAKFIKQ